MQNPVLNSKKKGDAADRILNPSADKHKMKEINNIADTTGRATYQSSPTKISPLWNNYILRWRIKSMCSQ